MPKKAPIDLDQFFKPVANDDDLSFLMGAAPEEAVKRAEERGLPLLHVPTEQIAPDPHQLRHLPHPDDLVRLAESGDRAAAAVLADLRRLGQSMAEHGQIQPVIIYRDPDPQDPGVSYRLLNGQRRWSGAMIMELPTIWAVEVPRPTDVVRLLQQFEENEQREGFSDMERAWALISLKEALQAEANGEVPWGVIEEQLQLSTARRQDLLRLLRFAPEAQALIMRYGWSEWTLRPLHMAINANEMTQQDATDMLRVLADEPEVNATVVAALVRGYREQASNTDAERDDPEATQTPSTRHNKSAQIEQRMARLRRGIEQLRAQLATVDDPAMRQVWQAEAEQLRASLTELLNEI
jgi:ParB/RepB/Spo0J family partition protein